MHQEVHIHWFCGLILRFFLYFRCLRWHNAQPSLRLLEREKEWWFFRNSMFPTLQFLSLLISSTWILTYGFWKKQLHLAFSTVGSYVREMRIPSPYLHGMLWYISTPKQHPFNLLEKIIEEIRIVIYISCSS